MTAELQEGGRKKVLPVVPEDCEIPGFLQDRLRLDCRSDRGMPIDALLGEFRSFGTWRFVARCDF